MPKTYCYLPPILGGIGLRGGKRLFVFLALKICFGSVVIIFYGSKCCLAAILELFAPSLIDHLPPTCAKKKTLGIALQGLI